MITGRRIAGSLIAAAALSLTLVPVAAAEPKAAPQEEVGSRVIEAVAARTIARSHDHGAKRGTVVSIVCAVDGKPAHGKAPHLSANDINRVIKLHRGKAADGGFSARSSRRNPGTGPSNPGQGRSAGAEAVPQVARKPLVRTQWL